MFAINKTTFHTPLPKFHTLNKKTKIPQLSIQIVLNRTHFHKILQLIKIQLTSFNF